MDNPSDNWPEGFVERFGQCQICEKIHRYVFDSRIHLDPVLQLPCGHGAGTLSFGYPIAEVTTEQGRWALEGKPPSTTRQKPATIKTGSIADEYCVFIRAAHFSGIPNQHIASMIGISAPSVSKIISYYAFDNIPPNINYNARSSNRRYRYPAILNSAHLDLWSKLVPDPADAIEASVLIKGMGELIQIQGKLHNGKVGEGYNRRHLELQLSEYNDKGHKNVTGGLLLPSSLFIVTLSEVGKQIQARLQNIKFTFKEQIYGRPK